MKEGKIKDSCIVIAGQSPKGSSYNEIGNGIEFHQGKKAFGEIYIQSSNVWTTEITKIAEPLDILMSVRAPVGPTNLTDRKICIGRGLAAIRCKGGVLHKYVLYALKNIESKIEGNDGAVFNSINKSQIEELPLPIIPLSEQEHIVAFLDAEFEKIDQLKANAAAQLQAAKDLFQAALKEMLTPKEGWVEKKIGEICEVTDYVANGSFATLRENVKYLDTPNYAVLVRLADYSSNFDKSKFVYVDKHSYDFLSKSSLKGGEIIMSNIGSIGKCFICPDLGMPMTIGPNSLLIRSPYSQFYIYYFQCELFQEKLKTITNQATLLKFNKTQFRGLSIKIPNFSTQQRIAERLDAISEKVKALQSNYDQTLTLCNDLKQALLKSIFE